MIFFINISIYSRSVTAARLVYTCAIINFVAPLILSKNWRNTSVMLKALLDSLLMTWTLLIPAENSAIIFMSLAIHYLTSKHQRNAFVFNYILGWAIYFAMVNYKNCILSNAVTGICQFTKISMCVIIFRATATVHQQSTLTLAIRA